MRACHVVCVNQEPAAKPGSEFRIGEEFITFKEAESS